MYAPYVPHMKLGQGYNSYLQETCLEGAVEVLEFVEYGQQKPAPPQPAESTPDTKIRWAITDDQNQLENFKNLIEWQGISPGAVMKNGLLNSGIAVSYLDKNKLKDSHCHSQFDVSVSIKKQPRSAHKDFRFHPLSSASVPNRAIYGDCFISDFIEGGEFYGRVSMKGGKEKTPEETQASADLALRIGSSHTGGEISVATKKMSEIIARSISSISVEFNGCDAKDINPWTLDGLQRAAETFSEQVKKTPSKTFAVLTPYKNIRCFHECNPGFTPLDYSKSSVKTNQMFDRYLKYEKLKLELQRRIKDDPVVWGGLEALEEAVGNCDEQLECIRKNVHIEATDPGGGSTRHVYIRPSDFEQKMMPAQVPVNMYIRECSSPHRIVFDFFSIGTSTSTAGWAHRYTLKVFKYPAPHTIKISIGFLTNPDRAMVFSKQNESHIGDGWDMNIHFYVYDSVQPNSEFISVSDAPDPWRCVTTKSVYNNDGWTHRLAFWAPL